MFEGLWAQQHAMSVKGWALAILVVVLLVSSPRKLPSWNVSFLDKLPTYLRHKAFTLAYLNYGAEVIEYQYRKSQGQPFELQTPGKHVVVVSSPEHIKELSRASPTALSMHGAAKEIMQPAYTMLGFDMKEQRGVDGLAFLRAIRKDFTAQLPNMFTMLEQAVSDEFSREFAECKTVDGHKQVRLFSMANRVIARANCTACFGTELSSDPKIVNAAMQFVKDTYISGEIIRALPKVIALPIASLLTRRFRACRVLFDTLCITIERRRSRAKHSVAGTEKPMDGLQAMINACPEEVSWTATRIAHEALGVFFFSVLGLTNTTAFALADLCTYAEHVPPLRRELAGNWAGFEKNAEGLPLLDSFLKESARLNGTEWVSGRRKALVPFTFSDGLRVPDGSWLYLHMGSINRDAKVFTDPLRFDGTRFARGSPSRFTDASANWLLWGTGRVVCPGRFYSSCIIKLVLAYVLRGYECDLLDRGKPQKFMWRTSVLPRTDLMMLLKPREEKD